MIRFTIQKYRTVESTNTLLREFAKKGAPEGLCLIADHQTAGRGRMGRSFHSPEATGLYLSVLLRPKSFLSPAALTCLAGVALWETVSSYGIDSALKWVNDLYVGNRKAAGILTEGSFRTDPLDNFAVIGFGVNLFEPIGGFPQELQTIAVSLFQTDYDASLRDAFAARLLEHLAKRYEKLPTIDFFDVYREHLNCLNRPVICTIEGAERRGISVDIDNDFRLLVRLEDGNIRALESGEIRFIYD